MISTDYAAFLDRRSQVERHGFAPLWMPSFLIDFQAALVEWSIVMGASAIFADCGLGKTPMQFVWSENVVRKTNGRVLIIAPLAVSQQTVREAEKFGVQVTRSKDGKAHDGITITNYERLHLFDAKDFVGAVCDESGILKSFDGEYRSQITEFMRKLRYRLLCTATPAPNDFTELGTSSEALGGLGHMDMLTRFFTNKNATGAAGTRQFGKAVEWRFKGHAEVPFWRWVCSWARAVRKPSDLGFEDGRFVLPPLTYREHAVRASRPSGSTLFEMPAETLDEQRAERRRTIQERCEKVAALVSHDRPALVWCHLNDEGDLLETLIPGAVQVSGSDSDDEKEERLTAFARGKIRCLVSKPKIGAWGLNFQHCAHVTFFPSHSFEQFYQSVRRCWRFGQERPVTVDIVTSDGERGVLENMERKARAADRMFERLVSLMGESMNVSRGGYGDVREEIPSWLL